ncbi:protein XRI1 [Iris pallida]|uniref:Protein XRI1 n=1 Tax=Iris pallida TaxID=29817 RepID=A0AAX6E1A5_IRIPA|nr:protein XRI1 [Iris pallida]
MDFDDNNSNNNDNNDMFEWREEEYCLQRDTGYDVSHCLWDEVNVSTDNLVNMFDDQTPTKDCLDFGYQVPNAGDSSNKGLEERTETSQMKRRRILQFTSDTSNFGVNDEQLTSAREDLLMEDGLPHDLEWNAQWDSTVHEDTGNFNCEGWDLPSAGLPANCVNESEMHCSTKETYNYIASDVQVDIPEFCNISPQMELDLVQKTTSPASIKISKVRKSNLRSPKKLSTSVAYPFALIKPCGVQGDVTLKDINQRIHAPPPSRSRDTNDGISLPNYTTSALTGKPVVVKTKIRTEGGKGSITITRTKG